MPETISPELVEMIGNLSGFPREHEKFYAQAPLRQAVESPTDRPVMSRSPVRAISTRPG